MYRPRFGLFSQPVSTAIGETNYFKPTAPRRNDEGEVITDNRNFYTKKGKNGKADDVYFMKSSYNCTGDPYKHLQMAGLRTLVKDGY